MENVLFFLVLSSVTCVLLQSVTAEVPAIFILGDSTSDVGTNNDLPNSSFKANFPYNGIDFPFKRSTGRFSNGFNTADYLAKLFGFNRSPPTFLSQNGTNAIRKPKFRGVNFASAGCGLLDLTGQAPTHENNVVPMGEQLYQFSIVHQDLLAFKGPTETEKFLSKSLFFISIGSNDILGNYYSSKPISKELFIPNLGKVYEKFLRDLISLGARKFGIVSVAPIGCCPSQRVSQNGECLKELNDQASAFFSTMTPILKNLSSEYKDVKYSLGNAVEMTMNVINNAKDFNFKDVKSACCGNGTLNAQGPCVLKANLCPKRDEYLFWDMFHPTQKASQLAAFALYTGGPQFVSPINFSQLPDAN